MIATYPAYQSLYENVKTLQCDVDYWSVKDAESGWTFDVDDLRRLLRTDTKLLVVNFPHNPTGAIPSKEDWISIVDLCKSRDIFLFSDEMYRLTNNDGTEPLLSATALYDKAVSLFGMSKTLALPGLRLGWLCSKHSDTFGMMQSFKDYTTICGPGPSEILSLIALRNKRRIIDRTLGIIERNLAILNDFMKEHQDVFCWKPPRAGTTGLLEVKGWLLGLGSGGAAGFCDVLVRTSQVLLLPSTMYDFPGEYVRLSFGRSDMPECLQQLKVFLKERNPK